jgi:hypothetical protein
MIATAFLALAAPTAASAAAPALAPPVLDGTSSPAPSVLRDLHRQWSAIQDELQQVHWQTRQRYDRTLRPITVPGGPRGILCSAAEIDAEMDGRLADAGTRRKVAALERERGRLKKELEERRAASREREDQLGITELKQRCAALEGEAAAMLDAIQRASVSAIEDIAALLDIALYAELDVLFASWFAKENPWLARLIRELDAAVPGFEFAAIKRSIPLDGRPTSYERQFAWLLGNGTRG